MTINDDGREPGNGFIDTAPLRPVEVPQELWATHPILSRARLNASGDTLEWPRSTFEQLAELREILLVRDNGALVARHGARFNFDRFVDATFDEHQPVPRIGRLDDVQRYYTRVTDNGFHVVGVFSAVTIHGRRRYFQWLTGTWVDIGQSGFLYVRDDLDTHFSEVGETQLEEYQPGSTTVPVPAGDDEWTMENFEAHFSSKSEIDNASTSAAEPEAAQPEAPVASLPEVVEPIAEPIAEPMADQVAEPVAANETDDSNAEREEGAQHVAEVPTLEGDDHVDDSDHQTRDADGTPMTEVDAMVQHGMAAALASIAHRGQVDKIGAAYIDHPARVAERFDWLGEPVHHCAAWLHDVVEDSDITEQDLLDAGILPETVDVVALLTRRSDVSDGDYYARINANPIARAVKLADIADNCAAWRVRRLEPELQASLAQKHAAARVLLAVAPGE